jgi:hypothetical protein
VRCSNSPFIVLEWSGGGFPDAIGSAMMGIFATVTREFCWQVDIQAVLAEPRESENRSFFLCRVYILQLLCHEHVREAPLEVGCR